VTVEQASGAGVPAPRARRGGHEWRHHDEGRTARAFPSSRLRRAPFSSLGDLCAAWSQARQRNAIGALNSSVQWHEFNSDPSKLQLVEARKHQMTELANLCNVPQVLVGADAGTGMTYNNVQESQRALYMSAKQYIECISQTLSMDNVLPRGRFCKLDISDYIEDGEQEDMIDTPDPIANVRTQ